MKILANDGISVQGIEKLKDKGFEVLTVKVAQNQLANYINTNKVDVLLVRSATVVDKSLIDECPSLKLIGRAGVGTDNIDVDYAKSKGLHVINTPNASTNSVAEMVFAHLFSGVRFLHDSNRNMPLEGDTNFDSLKKSYAGGVELRGKTLGIIGFGRIGQAVAEIAISLGMRVLAYDPKVKKATFTLTFFNDSSIDFEIETVSQSEVLKKSDFITLHVPVQKKGYLIDEADFEKMKKGVGIVNVSRGGIINEKALIEALDAEQVSFAGLDVFENEPSPAIKLLMHPQVSLSPHVGGASQEAQIRVGEELAEQIIKLLD